MLLLIVSIVEACPTDRCLLYLLFFVAGLVILLVSLYKGRHPWDVGLDRYDTPQALEDPSIPIEAMNEMSGHLFRRDYLAAHQCMLRHTNWFYTHRFHLPSDFAHLWLMIRTKINRMVAVEKWPQEWAQRDLEQLRDETVQLLNQTMNLFSEFYDFDEMSEEGTVVIDMPQSTRSISAPSDRNLSSMRS